MDTTQKQIESRFRYTDTYKNRKQGFCQSLDEWIAVQEASLTILRQRKAVLDDILTRLG